LTRDNGGRMLLPQLCYSVASYAGCEAIAHIS
jgi:hypothetical protein